MIPSKIFVLQMGSFQSHSTDMAKASYKLLPFSLENYSSCSTFADFRSFKVHTLSTVPCNSSNSSQKSFRVLDYRIDQANSQSHCVETKI